MTSLRVVALAVGLGGLALPAARAQPTSEEREELQKTQPRGLEAHGRSERSEVVSLRMRFYADDEHRSGTVRLQDRVRRTLDEINKVIEPALGVRFEVESVKSWVRRGRSDKLEPVLVELEQHDPGRDVDWVVGLVGPLGHVSNEMHQTGIARTLGRHFVLRTVFSVVELAAFRQRFAQLERANPAELHLIYTRRKEHQEAVMFLHEWAHTLGGLHAAEPSRILCPTYFPTSGVLAPVDVGLLAAALKDRLAARGEIERAANPAEAHRRIDWANLRRFLKATRADEWMHGEREDLIATLEGKASPRGDGPAPAAGLDPQASAIYNRALELYRARKDAEAWGALAPLLAAQPRSPIIEPLLCRLSALPAARKVGLAACEAALARAARDDAGPFVDAAHAALARGARAVAFSHAREAATRAGRAPPPNTAAFLTIAGLYGQIGAFSAADEALARAGTGAEVEVVRKQLVRARRFYGVPARAEALAPAREAEHAAAFTEANAAISAGKLAQARRAVAAGQRDFPGAPGWHVLACDLAMRQGRNGDAQKSCKAALAAMEDIPRAHYLIGHLEVARGNGAAAITSFRRAATLDPSVPAYWERLADTYSILGRSKDARAVAAERARALAEP